MNKKTIVMFALVFAFMFSLLIVSANSVNNGNNAVASTNAEKLNLQNQNDDSLLSIQNRNRIEMKTRTFSNSEGKEISVRVEGLDKPEISVGKSTAKCENCVLESENANGETKIFAKATDGSSREIKVMPDTASVKALNRLRVKNCNESEGCTIELKQTGEGNQSRLMYGVTVQKRAKIFGLFATKMKVSAEVDAETGNVIKATKPWWAFLASESDEQPEEVDDLVKDEVDELFENQIE